VGDLIRRRLRGEPPHGQGHRATPQTIFTKIDIRSDLAGMAGFEPAASCSQSPPVARRRPASPDVPFTCDDYHWTWPDVARCLSPLTPDLALGDLISAANLRRPGFLSARGGTRSPRRTQTRKSPRPVQTAMQHVLKPAGRRCPVNANQREAALQPVRLASTNHAEISAVPWPAAAFARGSVGIRGRYPSWSRRRVR
jgi:hypothetical protein